MLARLIAFLLIVAPATESSAQEPTNQLAGEARTLIRVSSFPSGAPIQVDEQPCGETPALIEVDPGQHVVEVSHDGERRRANVEVSLGEVAQFVASFIAGEVDRQAPAEAERSLMPRPREVPQERWARRVHGYPIFTFGLETGFLTRAFHVFIDPNLDVRSRGAASLEVAPTAVLGLRADLYPLARVRYRALRGLGLEFNLTSVLGLEISSTSGQLVDARGLDVSFALIYLLTLGRADAGATLSARLGWHRMNFQLGREGNDLIPPMVYDSLQIGLGAQIPLGTRHLLFEVHASYLAVLSLGDLIEIAYGELRDDPRGAEVRLGLIGRVGLFEFGLAWIGRWYSSEYGGPGEGWGNEYDTDTTAGFRGIQTTEPASDSIQQLRISLGFRI